MVPQLLLTTFLLTSLCFCHPYLPKLLDVQIDVAYYESVGVGGDRYESQQQPIDPEVFQNALEIIQDKGYQADEHIVETPDHYLLTVHHIFPKKKTSGKPKVAFLQHGLLSSAHCWIANLANESLAFMLADEGYDVWLGNNRGSTYGRKHTVLDVNQREFWEFSWDEIAALDLPATVDYILNVTKSQRLYYVGHSQGCQIALAKMNSDVNFQKKIIAMAALAPVAYLGTVKSPIRHLAPLFKKWETAIEWLGKGEFFPSNAIMKFLATVFCRHKHMPFFCSNAIFVFAGPNFSDLNITRIPVYLSHAPAGTSVRNIVHYSQAMLTNTFQMFDFGAEGNQAAYGQRTPPKYGLQNISIPIRVFSGGQDWLAVLDDVKRIVKELSKAQVDLVIIDKYNHLDFVWGLTSADQVYKPIIEYFNTVKP